MGTPKNSHLAVRVIIDAHTRMGAAATTSATLRAHVVTTTEIDGSRPLYEYGTLYPSCRSLSMVEWHKKEWDVDGLAVDAYCYADDEGAVHLAQTRIGLVPDLATHAGLYDEWEMQRRLVTLRHIRQTLARYTAREGAALDAADDIVRFARAFGIQRFLVSYPRGYRSDVTGARWHEARLEGAARSIRDAVGMAVKQMGWWSETQRSRHLVRAS